MGFLDDFEMETIRGKKVSESVVKQEKKQINKADYTDTEEEKITLFKKFVLDDSYNDFTIEQYPYSLNFYDFEVFKYDWCVTIINPIEKTKIIIVNDKKALVDYYNKHYKQIWVGYNSRVYDTYILKSILLGINPKYTSDAIIKYEMRGWEINEEFNNIELYDYDLYKNNSLKTLEGFMGNDIKETSVEFDIDRVLNRSEVKETIKYNIHDVEQTIEVFRLKKNDYNSHIDLINTFNLPLSMVSLTQARIVCNILECQKKQWDDEFDLKFVNCLRIARYKHIFDWFKNKENMNYKKGLTVDVCGIPHTFGWGGLHGCISEPCYIEGKIYHVDVTSFYPSLMIEYDFLTRNCKDKEKYKQIYKKRVELKKAGKKKEQAPYKIILNSTYGISKDKYSTAYDPRQANNVCVNGQLLLLDLLEHLEPYVDIIQSNTDGIFLKVEDKNEEKMKSVCYEWIERTKMQLDFDVISKMWQKDVNNYLAIYENGKIERKGAYVMAQDSLNYDLPIVNEGIINYLTKGVSIEDTVNNCDDLIKFQKIIKVSKEYKFGWHNGKRLSDKTFRVFASNSISDTYIGKCKGDNKTIEKFANTPQHCFIDNGNIKGKKVGINLNKKYYIELTTKRLKDFGVDVNADKEMGLF